MISKSTPAEPKKVAWLQRFHSRCRCVATCAKTLRDWVR